MICAKMGDEKVIRNFANTPQAGHVRVESQEKRERERGREEENLASERELRVTKTSCTTSC